MTNYVRAYELYQSGAEAIKPTGVLTLDTQPTANDTITIGGVVYTFKVSATVAGDIARGADLAAAKVNLVAAINGDSLNAANPYVVAAAFISNNMTITARVAGTAGNSVATTETFTAGTNVFANTTLTGGAQARGTAVAATSKLPYPIEFEDDGAVERSEFALGIGWENVGQEKVVAAGTKFKIAERPLYFEFLPILETWGVLGAPAITGTAVPLTYTATPGIAADPAYQSRTLERRLSDGTNNLDDEWAYAMLEKWGIKWGQRGLVMLTGTEGFARVRKNSTLTAAMSVPTLTQIPTALVQVYVNDSWATLGNTAITGQVIGGEFEYRTGEQHEETADGRTDLDFAIAEFNPMARGFSLKLRVKVKDSGFAYTERAKAAAQSVRAVRVRLVDATTGQSLNLDGLYTHETTDGLVKVGEQDGQDIVEMSLVQSTDATNVFRMVAVTNQPTTD